MLEIVSPFDRVVIDIGTGDGLFVYRCAQTDSRTFFMGIDANRRPLQKLSEKIYRKASRGGLPNVMFAQAAVEDLPPELAGIASEVHVNFPWGSLLRTVVGADVATLRNLKHICSEQALLKVVVGIDPVRDRAELVRLGLPEINLAHLRSTLPLAYTSAGFEIIETGELDATAWGAVETSWARRLRGKTGRVGIYLLARTINADD